MKTSAFCCAQQHCTWSPLPPPRASLPHTLPEAEETHKARPALCLTPGESCSLYEQASFRSPLYSIRIFDFLMRF